MSGLLRAAGRVTGCCCLPVSALLTVLTLAGGCAVPDSSKRERQVFNVADYGAEGDGQTLNTGAIRKAMDAAAKVGGGGCFRLAPTSAARSSSSPASNSGSAKA